MELFGMARPINQDHGTRRQNLTNSSKVYGNYYCHFISYGAPSHHRR